MTPSRSEDKDGNTRIVEVKKAYIIRIKRGKLQRKAVGGFYESMMAMLIITVAVLILTSTLSSIPSCDESENDYYAECRLAADRLLSNRTIMDGESIDFHSIQWIDIMDLRDKEGFEISVTIIEIQNGRSVLIFSNSTGQKFGEVASFTTPATTSHSPTDIRPALLTVSAWEE